MPDPLNPFGGVPELVRSALEEKLGDYIVDALDDLLSGAEEDIRTFGLQIAHAAVVAGVRQDEDWLGEIRAQVDLLLEANRIRVVRKQNWLVMQVIEAIVRTAFKTALAFGAQALSGAFLGEEGNLIERIRR